MKLCIRCQTAKPETEFSPSPRAPDGLYTYCKPCAAAHRREMRQIEKAGQKVCGKCGETKPLDDFYHHRYGAARRQHWCKTCQKTAILTGYKNDPKKHAAYNRQWDRRNPEKKADSALKTRRGLAHGTYAQMLTAQDGKCAICGTASGPRRFHVDHDHDTGQIRGLLCSPCNTGIGQLKHSEDVLLRAIAYLRLSVKSGV
jgi:Autographiviridae endonuclease VII